VTHANRFTATARRQLTDALPEAVAIAALGLIQGPRAANTHRVGKQLMPPLDDRWSARRGTYLIVYRIDEQASLVTVIAIAPRSDAYRTP
jgi:mRNA-degrading endonuclease RelE of RelBE toxin-antitoxin system